MCYNDVVLYPASGKLLVAGAVGALQSPPNGASDICLRGSDLCGNNGTHAYRSTLRAGGDGNRQHRSAAFSGAFCGALSVAKMVAARVC